MSRRQSQGGRNPAEECAEHFQRLRTRRFSVHRREDLKPPPPSRVIHGQPSQTAAEIAAARHPNLGTGRRQSSGTEVDENATYNAPPIQMHRMSLPETLPTIGPEPDTETVVMDTVPVQAEKPGRRKLSHTPATLVPLREQYENPVVGNISAANYEPTYILRQNAEYFDVDQDGIIWPRDTYRGCRKLGWGILTSCLAMLALHSIFSYATCPGYLPDLSLRIRYDSTHHPGHSSYKAPCDEKGQTRHDQACEGILSKYDNIDKGGMTFRDILHFWNAQRPMFNCYGWGITVLEWLTLYLFLWPRNGVMRSEDIRAAFDGSLLYKKAEERHHRIEMHRKQENYGSGHRNRRQPNPVKLAVAIIAGFAILIWAVRNLTHNSSGWASFWWRKENAQEGASWTNPRLFF
ncbi:Caleosin related protein-domain-containing protein [Jackrogersella minutella]|nr:Caleosin related protein-domain-containing protein [Jackrogersella minutella]